MTAKVGPKGRHDPDLDRPRGSVVLGGRTVPVRRPRATVTGGGELRLDAYEAFSSTELLSQLAMERMLAGVATRHHALVAEPIGAELEQAARGDSKSAVSRRFKTASEAALGELIGRDPPGVAADPEVELDTAYHCACAFRNRQSRECSLLIDDPGQLLVLRSQHNRTPSCSRPPEHCVLQLLERGNSSSRPAVANTPSIGRAIV